VFARSEVSGLDEATEFHFLLSIEQGNFVDFAKVSLEAAVGCDGGPLRKAARGGEEGGGALFICDCFGRPEVPSLGLRSFRLAIQRSSSFADRRSSWLARLG